MKESWIIFRLRNSKIGLACNVVLPDGWKLMRHNNEGLFLNSWVYPQINFNDKTWDAIESIVYEDGVEGWY